MRSSTTITSTPKLEGRKNQNKKERKEEGKKVGKGKSSNGNITVIIEYFK
jgi:hypothetical protein